MRCVLLISVAVAVVGSHGFAGDEPSATPAKTLTIERGELSVLFRDNSDSPQVLSGIDSLFNTQHAPAFDAFDPDGRGSSAGLNFEHIISGHESPNNKFTPRSGPFALIPRRDGKTVRLERRREDCPWNIASTLEYTVAEPSYVDFRFRCTPHEAELFGRRGHAIFFFANYMNDVADVAVNFRGIDQPGGEEKWISADAPKDHADWNGGGTYRHVDAAELEYDDDVQFRLNSWSYEFPRFTQPVYFGRAARGMVFMLMFDKAHNETEEMRFSLFKFKVPRHPRPAWDFQYVIHRVEEGKTYGFDGRLVWKKFIDADDCLREYEAWRRTR